ncbi:YtxH domain-containing protein [Frigoribacterium faeni]|uniref:Uncharacterized protein YjbJ (UPF0337 family) n=1 Tax=Frigoribacterium faeni TaxID=145483 RepID=A0A7W3JJJ5_9MICO|nr:YtxH domain-containing protein [Frigoribacterium faeni]MBA8814041.1 uncharacterized protein YjbJ (UPF0337 family) [Frigoribacterium faeni]GEK84078.1 hypothetical protein FFA01_23870 [Frigoribacterium faeni]
MKGKILFVAGAAVGYVLGARAGRGAYVKIKDQAESLWENPTVQKTVHQAEDFVKDNAPVVGKKLQEAAGDAASAAGSKAKSVAGKASGKASSAAEDATAAARTAADKVRDSGSDSGDSSAVGTDDGEADTGDRANGTSKLPGVNVGE